MTATRSAYGPPLRYPGSKWRLAGRINALLPATGVYLEPFGGSASVLLQRDPSQVEVFNDLDQDVTAFWRCLRTDPDRLIRLVSLTPYSRSEYESSARPGGDSGDCDDYERARLFVVRTWQGFGSKIAGAKGWRRTIHRSKEQRTRQWRNPASDDWVNLPDRLAVVADRIRPVEIECRSATRLIRERGTADTAIYADPPYHPDTVIDPRFYKHRLTPEQHLDLLATLAAHPGPVVLSGYAHEDYDRMLRGWRREEHASLADGGRRRTEVLWINGAALDGAPRLSALKESQGKSQPAGGQG